MIKVDIQIACENYNVPSKEDFETWIMLSIRNIDFILEQDFEIGVRVVNENESKRLNIPFLAEIPYSNDLMKSIDDGNPIVFQEKDSEIKNIFVDLAKKVMLL